MTEKHDHRKTRRTQYRLRKRAGKLVGGRNGRCGRVRIASTVTAHVCDGKAHFTGIETCGSIWSCPVCAPKIMNRNRDDVGKAITEHMKTGGAVYMVAFTAAHYQGQRLKPLKDSISGGWSKLIAGRKWKDLKSDYGLVGYIRALEVTWSPKNGWHPHSHVLFFTKDVLSEDVRDWMERDLFHRWDGIVQREQKKNGFPETPCNRSIFRLEQCATPEAAGDYIAKWGAEHEITHLHSKSAKGGGLTPWDMLHLADKGGDRAGRTFREFASAMKGARHLTWSGGLKRRYGIDEISDDDAAQETSEGAVLVIDGDDFDGITRAGLRCDLLDILEKGGAKAALEYLKSVVAVMRTEETNQRRAAYFDGVGLVDPRTGVFSEIRSEDSGIENRI